MPPAPARARSAAPPAPRPGARPATRVPGDDGRPRSCSLQVAVPQVHVHRHAPLAVLPEVGGIEADRVGRLAAAGGAVRLDIGHRVAAVQPYHCPCLAPDVARAAGVTGRVPLAYPDPVADPEARLPDVGTGVS